MYVRVLYFKLFVPVGLYMYNVPVHVHVHVCMHMFTCPLLSLRSLVVNWYLLLMTSLLDRAQSTSLR